MLDRFRAHLAASNLIPPGATVLVGYSGGPDSTCLLTLLKEAGIDVVAAYLLHGLREEADKEQALCSAYADSIGAPFVSGRAEVGKIADDMGIGLEEAGRRARYAFFEQVAGRTNCDLIATAHTKSDLAETVLLNLTRGSGMSGAAGIPERRGRIIRPLLPFSRSETVEFCAQRGLWTCDDPANVDLEFSRARVRHRVVPELAAINPAAEDAIARFASIVGEEDRFLDGAAAAALEQCEVPLNGELAFLTRDCEIAFSRVALSHLPAVLFRRAIRLATEAVGGTLDRAQTIAIEGALRDAQGKGSLTCEGGRVVVEWSLDDVVVRDLQPIEPFRYPLTVPGETESEEFGWTFVAYKGEGGPNDQRRDGFHAVANPAGVKGRLYFRTSEPGDTIAPYGFEGTRKVSDILSESGLTSAARRRLPIICDMVGPIWIPGVCLSNRVKCTDIVSGALHIRFGPLTEPGASNVETLGLNQT